jgi:hypothetical protein
MDSIGSHAAAAGVVPWILLVLTPLLLASYHGFYWFSHRYYWLEARIRVMQEHASRALLLFTVATIIFAAPLRRRWQSPLRRSTKHAMGCSQLHVGMLQMLRFILQLVVMVGPLHGARFRQKLTLEDAIGSHACSLEALACV